MRRLLDTSFLVHCLTRPPAVEAYLAEHDTPETTFLASAMSLKELAVGLHHVEAEPTLADLTGDLAWLDVVPFGPRHAFHAGAIEHDCRDRGLPQNRLNALRGGHPHRRHRQRRGRDRRDQEHGGLPADARRPGRVVLTGEVDPIYSTGQKGT